MRLRLDMGHGSSWSHRDSRRWNWSQFEYIFASLDLFIFFWEDDSFLRDLFASLDLFSKFSTGPLWIFQVPFSCMEFTCLLGWWLLVVFPAVEEVAAADPARYRSTENRIHHPQFYHTWISMDGINHGINHHGWFILANANAKPSSHSFKSTRQYLSYWWFTITNISSYTAFPSVFVILMLYYY